MAINPIQAAGAALPTQGVGSAQSPTRTAGAGFGDTLSRSLQSVSDLEKQADDAATAFATGETTSVHEVMTATTKSRLAIDAVVAVRNRAVEAYQEIMRLQV